jgi:hypothetical protein
MTRSAELQAQRDRTDLWAAIIVCAVVIVVIVNQAVTAIAELFSVPGAVTTTVPIGPDAVPLPAGAGFTGTVISAQVSEPGVSPVATACFVIGIVLAALGLIAATALGCLFCVRMLRGKAFSRSNTRVLFAISMLLLLAPVAGSFFRNMGLNGLFAAAGSEYDGQWDATMALLPAFVAAIAVGVLVIAFRRGEHLQRDTEGLV